jgi:hypothetical protein
VTNPQFGKIFKRIIIFSQFTVSRVLLAETAYFLSLFATGDGRPAKCTVADLARLSMNAVQDIFSGLPG